MNTTSLFRLALPATLLLALSSCVTPYPGPAEREGGVAGALVGGLAGAVIGNQSGRPLEGAAIGGAIGALAGSAMGANQDAYYGGYGPYGAPAYAPACAPYYGPRPAYYAPRTNLSFGYSSGGWRGRSRYSAGFGRGYYGCAPAWGYPAYSCW